jgi:hypothetical protein
MHSAKEAASKGRPNIKTVCAQALATATVLLVAWLVWSRSQPELLFELGPKSPLGTIYHGMIYRIAYSDSIHREGPTIRARPVSNGPETILTSIEPPWLYAYEIPMSFTDNAVCLGLVKQGKAVNQYPPPRDTVAGRLVSSSSRTGMGATHITITYRENSGKSSTWTLLAPVRFVQTPLHDGPRRELHTILGDNIHIIGSHAFWTWPGDAAHSTVKRGDALWVKLDANSEIVWTDLQSGVQKSLTHSLPPSANLGVGDAGVLWTEAAPVDSDVKQLYYSRAEDGAKLPLGAISADESVGWSLEHRGSLYWFQTNNRSQPGQPTNRVDLMTANLSGGGSRKLYGLAEHRLYGSYGENLGTWNGQLYCLASEHVRASRSGSSQVCLARVHPERSEPIEIVHRFPMRSETFHFDNGFVYYVLPGVSRGLIETILDEHAGEKQVSTLYRLPLP